MFISYWFCFCGNPNIDPSWAKHYTMSYNSNRDMVRGLTGVSTQCNMRRIRKVEAKHCLIENKGI